MNTPTTTELLHAAKRGLLNNEQTRFWGILFDNLKFQGPHPEVKTAATDGKNLWINPAYFASLSPDDRTALIIHEVGHCALGQCTRGTRLLAQHPEYGHDLINRAMDYALNATLRDAGVSIPPGALHDTRFRNMRLEKIARALYDDKQDDNDDDQDDQQDDDDNQGENNNPSAPPVDGQCDLAGKLAETQPNKPAGAPQSPQNNPATPSNPAPSPDAPQTNPEPPTEAPESPDPTQNDAEWKEALARAGQLCGKGTPAAIVDAAAAARETPLSWQTMLKAYVRNAWDNNDYNWQRPNRRYLTEHRVYIPTCRNERADLFHIYRDTSGSIDAEHLAKFHTALEEIRAEFPEVPIRIIDIDTRIHTDQTITAGEPIPRTRGGGGTDLGIVFDHITDDGSPPPVIALYFTDLEGPHTDEPPAFPVIWINWGGNNLVAPFGETVQIEPE